MPITPATDYTELYDPESAIEAAVKSVLEDQGLVAVTVADSPEFQKARPRCEILFQNGAESGHAFILPDASIRADVWAGTLQLACVTSATSAPGVSASTQHRQYRAQVRSVCAGYFRTLKSPEVLPFHIIMDVEESGTSNEYKPQDGLWASNISFAVKYGIRPDAWPQIQSPLTA